MGALSNMKRCNTWQYTKGGFKISLKTQKNSKQFNLVTKHWRNRSASTACVTSTGTDDGNERSRF